jgi:hypothetical protein
MRQRYEYKLSYSKKNVSSLLLPNQAILTDMPGFSLDGKDDFVERGGCM